MSGWADPDSSWLMQWVSVPGVLEGLCVLLVLLVAWFLTRRWWRYADLFRCRRGARDAAAGWVHLRLGELTEARSRLERALERDAQDAVARFGLARTLLELGESAGAHKHLLMLREAVGEGVPEVEYRLALAAQHAGQTAAFLEHAAQSSDPRIQHLAAIARGTNSDSNPAAQPANLRFPPARELTQSAKARDADPLFRSSLDHPELVLDALDQNRAWIDRLVRTARSGDAEATQDLLALGPRAVPALALAAVDAGDPLDPAVAVLQTMGGVALEPLLRLYERETERPGTNVERWTAQVGAILTGMDRAALPAMEQLLDRGRDDGGDRLRPVVLDCLLSRDDPEALPTLLSHCSPPELARGLSRLPESVLSALATRADDRLGRLLALPGFTRCVVLATAFARVGSHGSAAEFALRNRSMWDSDAHAELVAALGGPGAARVDALLRTRVENDRQLQVALAGRLLDTDVTAIEVDAIVALLSAAGSDGARAAMELFGPIASPMDPRLTRALSGLDAQAVAAALCSDAASLHGKRMAIDALADSPDARAALVALDRSEGLTSELRLLLKRRLDSARNLDSARGPDSEGGDRGEAL